MLIITVQVDCPMGQAIGVKEQIAMDLERYGNTRVLRVNELDPQLTLEKAGRPRNAAGRKEEGKY